MLVGEEWSHCATERKPLRVSAPFGIQWSSYFVSMPFKYGGPLIGSMSLLHWLLSQSVFVIMIESYKSNGTLDPSPIHTFVTDGFSIIPIITGKTDPWTPWNPHTDGYDANLIMNPVCTLGCVMVIVLSVVSLSLKYRQGMPLASTNSAAISAACHAPPEDSESYLFPLKWGVVSVLPNETAHCSFTTARDVHEPVSGDHYA